MRVSLLALPDTYLSCLTGLYDTFAVAATRVAPAQAAFAVEIVAENERVDTRTSRIPIVAHRRLYDVRDTDIVLVPAAAVDDPTWRPGRYPDVVRWIQGMHGRGAVIGSACSGALLLAETGLLDGQEATTHWREARRFQSHFPKVQLRLEHELVVSGADGRLVTAGASSAWHDLALHLIARYNGPETAIAVARYFMLQWHSDGQRPYLPFDPVTRHGDAAVLRAQAWAEEHTTEDGLVAGMVSASALPVRTFTRRFRTATGYSPTDYVQRMRIEKAKDLLATTGRSVEQICWSVGYDDPASFRRLFKRIVGVTPGTYRRKFLVR